jgi:putative ABC transport system substrate-binding protein
MAALPEARAQSNAKVPRVGVLDGWPTDVFPGRLSAFKEGLRAAGYAEPANLQIVYRTANGKLGDLPALAAQLVSLKVDVVFAPTTLAAVAARDATREIPIVFAVAADPIGAKLVASLARPGGNVTGMTTGNTQVAPKRLQLLKEILKGKVSRIALVMNPGDQSNVVAAKAMQDAGRTLGIDVVPLEVRSAEDVERTFASLATARFDGIAVAAGALTDTHARRIAELAARARIPTMYGAPEYVEYGGLVSYSASFADNYRGAAGYVDRILRGAKPAELPVEQSSSFELVINRKTAAALGLSIAPSLLAQARVVE